MPTGNVSGVTSVTTTSCTANTTVNSDTRGSAPEVWCAAISGPATDGHSSPFVDYTNNVLYVGDDSGVLHKFTNVFHSNGNHSVPSEAWHATSVGAVQLSSPVYDSTSGLIFVDGTPSGELYSFSTAGALSATSTAVTLTVSPAFFDAPIVDSNSSSNFVYVVVGDNAVDSGHSGAYKYIAAFGNGSGGTSIVNYGTSTTTTMVYNGAFDAAYYGGTGTNAGKTGNFWVCETSSSGYPQLEGISMAGGALNTGTSTTLTSAAATCSPVTEFLNSTDDLFLSVTANGNLSTCSGSCVYSFTVSGQGNAPTKEDGLNTNTTGGTSGIIIDNSASSPGSNIYYEDLGDTDAVQVSQSTL
jgi:hypothetical protein